MEIPPIEKVKTLNFSWALPAQMWIIDIISSSGVKKTQKKLLEPSLMSRLMGRKAHNNLKNHKDSLLMTS